MALLASKTMLVCPGVAKQRGLRVSGKRNSFGLWIGARTDEWRSGTTPAFAVHFRSNSHTGPNQRVPPIPGAHEESCPSKKCQEAAAKYGTAAKLKSILRLMQRAQREVTGYYCGYTFKGQTIGKKHMARASTALDYLTPELSAKTVTQRMHQITNRVLTDLHHRCAARPATEEWNLAMFWHEQDVTNAEFHRTFMSVTFPGGQLVQRLEDEVQGRTARESRKVLPKNKKISDEEHVARTMVKHFADLYGFRGFLPKYAE
eukprot:3477507-Pyramimonas_sp.AAC.1